MFEDFPPMVGYAATAQLRSGEPPIAGRIYVDRTDWWNSILQVPAPRIVVLEDLDKPPGVGAFLGGMHAAILRALGCVGYVTDGAVMELPRVREQGLHLFAGNVAVSHAYAHIFDFGSKVKGPPWTFNGSQRDCSKYSRRRDQVAAGRAKGDRLLPYTGIFCRQVTACAQGIDLGDID
jgi:hypothetical protein